MFVIGSDWWQVNIGSGNGLVPSGYKPLPKLVTTSQWVKKTSGMGSVSHTPIKLVTNFIFYFWPDHIPRNIHVTNNNMMTNLSVENLFDLCCNCISITLPPSLYNWTFQESLPLIRLSLAVLVWNKSNWSELLHNGGWYAIGGSSKY